MSSSGEETPLTRQVEFESEYRASERAEELAMCFCPNCNARLLSLRCKLVCEQCGYFMSCADYY